MCDSFEAAFRVAVVAIGMGCQYMEGEKQYLGIWGSYTFAPFLLMVLLTHAW
jgi:hypothetical protein